jgi:hypothetical protein
VLCEYQKEILNTIQELTTCYMHSLNILHIIIHEHHVSFCVFLQISRMTSFKTWYLSSVIRLQTMKHNVFWWMILMVLRSVQQETTI